MIFAKFNYIAVALCSGMIVEIHVSLYHICKISSPMCLLPRLR